MDFNFNSIDSLKEFIASKGLKNCVQDWKLLKKSTDCVKCGGKMYINYGGKTNLIYRCGAKMCRVKKHVRDSTVFGLSRVPPVTLLSVLSAWILKYPFSVIVRETGLSRPTTRKLINSFREILVVWLIENSSKIGGIGKTVEVDESAFGKRKYNRGRVSKVRWVVGGIDRQNKKCFLKVVDRRDSQTLLSVISENVEPGTTIITDMWRGYNSLEQNGFPHKTVNHSVNFVSPNDRNIHTQTIESHWAKIKRDMRRRIGRMTVSTFESYLVEYVWRSTHFNNKELFEDFLRAINYFYPQ